MSGVVLRLVLVCHFFAGLAQSVFAGQFLSGSDGLVVYHEVTGWVLLAICAIQIVLAAVLMRSGMTSLSLLFSTVFVFLAEGLQVGTGYARFLDVHVPLGVVIVAVVIWQTIVVFLKQAPSQESK